MRLNRVLFTAVTAVAATGAASAFAVAQVTPSASTSRGLDALEDDRVLTELASRGMTDLLRHAFEEQGVPEVQRTALLARISLSRLENDDNLPTAERRQLVLDVVANVGQTVDEAQDPQLLLEQAQLLIDRGVNEEARLLEYFGENPELRRYLRPVADAVSRMLERSAELYRLQADEIANQIQSPGDSASRRWQQVNESVQLAQQYGIFADYNRVLAMDPDDPERLRLADALIEKVQPFDTESTARRTFIQSYLGKVALARGNEKGLQLARDYFDKVLAASSDETELFDAHYFRTVAEIRDRKLEEARKYFEQFAAWFDKQTLPDREPLMLVLRYRLEDAASHYGPTTRAKQEAQQTATRLLVQLVEEYEGYRSIVTDQLLARMETETDLTQLSPLLLDAMVDKGRAEAAKMATSHTGQASAAEEARVDREAIERGIAAAREMLRRARTPEAQGENRIDPALVARNVFLMGLMQDLIGRELEAARTFMSFENLPGADQTQKISAYRRALGIVEELEGSNLDPNQRVAVDELEGQLLPLLVNPPVNDKSRAFDLANRLHRLGQLEEAARYYGQVPDTDPRHTDAAYLRLLAETARLGELPTSSPRRAALARTLPQLGQQTLEQLQAAIAQSDGESRQAYRERQARVKVILARLALNESGVPERALELLGTLEQEVQDLPAGEEILNSALPLRFQATAAAGQIEQTTQDLLALLDRSQPERGLAYISQFRETLNRAMERARLRDDRAAERRLMETRAAVTPRLVSWIEQSQEPAYRRHIYTFRRFNAETLLEVARLTDAPAQRRERFLTALAAYENLQSAENLQAYRDLLENLSPQQRQQVPYDKDVVFAIANIHYELENYGEARSRYARLLADRAIGNATRTIEQDGVTQQVPNDDYWELYLKFIRSNLALGHPKDPMRQELRKLEVIHGDLGGNRWQEEFEALRHKLN